VRFETPAGRQAQVDFAEFRFPWGKATRCWSCSGTRGCCGVASHRRDMRTLLTGLEDAFLVFGGVPPELLFDQMKAVITQDLRLQGGAPIHNLEFLRFAQHWSFPPRACRPYRAQKQRQGGAPRARRPRESRVRARVPQRRRPRAARRLARARGECAPAWDRARAPTRAIRARRALAAPAAPRAFRAGASSCAAPRTCANRSQS
jgi:transposase